MSSLLARLQQQSRGNNNNNNSASSFGIFNNNNNNKNSAASVRSQQQRSAPATNRTNQQQQVAITSALEQQNKIMERFLSTIDRFQQERNEMAASHKAELIERDLLSDQVTLRFMIELEEQKKLKSKDASVKESSLVVDGTEKRRWKKGSGRTKKDSSRGRRNGGGGVSDSDNNESDTASSISSRSSSNTSSSSDGNASRRTSRSNNNKSKKGKSSSSRVTQQKTKIDMQNQQILLSKIQALESKLTTLTKKQEEQQRKLTSAAAASQTRARSHSTKSANRYERQQEKQYEDDDENDFSSTDNDDDDATHTTSKRLKASNSTSAARTKTATTTATRSKRQSAIAGASSSSLALKKESGARRQRDDGLSVAEDDDSDNGDETRSVRSVATTSMKSTVSVAAKQKKNKPVTAAAPAVIAKVNVVSSARQPGALSTDSSILSRSNENPFIHYLRYLKQNGNAAATREEGLARMKKILLGKASSAGVSASDAARKAIIHLFGRARTCLPDLNASVLVLNSDQESHPSLSVSAFNESSRILSQLVDVSEKSGYFGEVSSICQTLANVALSEKAGTSYQQLHMLSVLGCFLSFGLSSKVNPNDASRMVRSILYDSLLAVFLGLRHNRSSRDTDALKAREWIAFASSLLCSKDLGKNLNIFGVNFSDEKRDLVGLTIELAAQYLYTIADPTSSNNRHDDNNQQKQQHEEEEEEEEELQEFDLDSHWSALRKQLDWPLRYPDAMDMCQKFFDWAVGTCEKLTQQQRDQQQNNSINNKGSQHDSAVTSATNQTVFTIIQALRLLFHIISMQTSVGECIEALFPESSSLSSSSSGNGNLTQNNGENDGEDDELGGYNNQQQQNQQQQQGQIQEELDELNSWTLARSCLSSFIITDFDFDISQEEDAALSLSSSPTSHIIRALRVVTREKKPRVDSLLEFAQLVCVNAVLGSHGGSSSRGATTTMPRPRSQKLQLLLQECVNHARERQTGVQGQPAAMPFIGSELSGMLTRNLGEYFQN